MASDTTDLIIAVREGSSWSRHLSITVPAERVLRTRGRVADQIARGVRLPGFRKGKLPQRVIEQRFGAAIDQETMDRLVQEAYREALETQGITPISQGRVDDVHYHKDSELHFEVEVEVRPEIELKELSGLTATRPAAVVDDAEVDAVLERLRDEQADWQAIEEGARPDYGDRTLVEITSLEGESEEPRRYRITVGEGEAIPDVEAAILTLVPGESGEFTVAFPEDFPDEARRGQQQRLRIELKEARHKVLRDLDDEFAKSVGEFDSLEALRAAIRGNLEEEAKNRAEGEVRRQIIDQILTANPFEAPESMVQRYLGYLMGEDDDPEKRRSRTPEQEERLVELRQALRPQAEWGLKRMLVIERMAELEGLRATQDEIDERVEAIAARHGRSPSEVWIQLEKSGDLEGLEREITEEKVFAHLKSENGIE